MANLETTTDLRGYVLEGFGELTDGTSSYTTKTLTQLNRAYRLIVGGGMGLSERFKTPVLFPWALAQYPKVINFEAPITTGSVNVANGSTSITFSSAPASSVAGWYFKVAGEPEVYRISAHTGGAAGATLDAAYVGTNAATASYKLFRLRYTLGSDILAPVTPIRCFQSQFGQEGRRQIDLIGKRELDRKWPLTEVIQQFPTKAAIVFQTEGTFTIQLNSYPANMERVEIDYIAQPTVLDLVGSNPILPVHHRIAIAEWALFFMMRESDDERMGDQLGIAEAAFAALAGEARALNKVGSDAMGMMVPWWGDALGEGDRIRTVDGFIIG